MALHWPHNRVTIVVGGGGVGGAFALGCLSVLRAHPFFGMRSDDRPFIATVGTSVGSMIAAGLVLGVQHHEMWRLYRDALPYIFKRTGLPWPLSSAPYDISRVKEVVHSFTGDLTFADLRQSKYGARQLSFFPVAVDISRPPARIKRWRPSDRLDDAIASSAAAPTYFSPYQGCVDGGLISNTPAAVAAVACPADHYIVIRNGAQSEDPTRLDKITPLVVADMIATMITARDRLEIEYARDELRALVLEPPMGIAFDLDDAKPATSQRLYDLGVYAAKSTVAQIWLDSRCHPFG